jgi:hypothetical protein
MNGQLGKWIHSFMTGVLGWENMVGKVRRGSGVVVYPTVSK